MGHPRGNSSISTSILHQPQRYTDLALWRVIHFCKESLSVISLCWGLLRNNVIFFATTSKLFYKKDLQRAWRSGIWTYLYFSGLFISKYVQVHVIYYLCTYRISCNHQLRTHKGYIPNSLRPKFKSQPQIDNWDVEINADIFFRNNG